MGSGRKQRPEERVSAHQCSAGSSPTKRTAALGRAIASCREPYAGPLWLTEHRWHLYVRASAPVLAIFDKLRRSRELRWTF